MTKLYIINIIPQSNNYSFYRNNNKSGYSSSLYHHQNNNNNNNTVHFSTVVKINHSSMIYLVRDTKPGETKKNINKYCLKNGRSVKS
ncbi:unnamed protein product [Cunninghamella blakesleeana]